MKKKKICIAIYSMGGGGAEKALLNWLKVIDYNNNDVDLQLFSNSGINLKYLPQEVNLLPALLDKYPEIISTKKIILSSLKQFNISMVIKILISRIKGIGKNNRCKSFYMWNIISKIFGKNETKYDIAIGYMHGNPTYYVADNIDAKIKYAWVHNDYENIDQVREEYDYLKRFSAIYTISEKCVISLKKYFPELKNIRLIYNINLSNNIIELSNQPIELLKKENSLVLLTSGRLIAQKGYDLAIKAAKILNDENIDFKWYILGDGDLKKDLKKMVDENGLSRKIIFLGLKSNPYPYMKMADIIVQTSRFEGKSVVLDEAKILGKPIVVTNYNSVEDQIQNGYDGMIVPMLPEEISNGIIKMCQKDVRQEYINRLEEELNKIQQNEKKLIEKYDNLLKSDFLITKEENKLENGK